MSIFVGVLGGVGAAVFLYLINFSTEVFTYYPNYLLAPLIIVTPALGGLIVGAIAYKFSPESGGDEMPEVIEAIIRKKGKIRARVPIATMFTSAATIGSGGSTGYEAPMAQIGGGAGSVLGRIFKMDDESVKILVVCGAAAGISAIFKAPLGGVFFGLEIVYMGVEAIALIPVVVSSFVSTTIAQGILGVEPILRLRTFTVVNPFEYLLFFILGLAFGLLSAVWVKVFHYVHRLFRRLKVPKYLKPAIGGLILGVIIFFFPQISGAGYSVIDQFLVVPITIGLFLILGVLKMIGTSITLGSEGAGGTFAPMMFMGAMFGGAYGVAMQWLLYGKTFGPLTPLLPYIGSSMGPIAQYVSPAFVFQPMAYALVGMAALIASSARAPLTGIVLITEITLNYAMILPLMLASITAYLISRLILKRGISREALMEKGIDVSEERRVDILDRVTAGDVMSKPVIVSSDMQIFQVLEMMGKYRHHGFPVLDDGDLIGVIDAETVDREMDEKHETRRVGEVVDRNIATVYPEETLRQTLYKMLENETERIIVVSRNNPKRVIGIVTHTDILEVQEIRLIMKRGGKVRKKLQRVARIDQEFREEKEM